MPAPRHHRPLSALWIGALAIAGAWGALGGEGIGSAPTPQATQLALAAGFVPDESSLPATLGPAGSADGAEASAPAFPAGTTERKSAPTVDSIPNVQWNGHGDQRWTLADGRTFVVSSWGATWWLASDGRLRRTRLDLSGHDPARPSRYIEGVGLLLGERDGSTRVIDLSGTEPTARVVPPDQPV